MSFRQSIGSLFNKDKDKRKSVSMSGWDSQQALSSTSSFVSPKGSRTMSNRTMGLIKNKQKINRRRSLDQPLKNSGGMGLQKSKSLPCISSWDVYGDDTVQITFSEAHSLASFSPKISGEHPKPAFEKVKYDDIVYELKGDPKQQILYAATKEKLLSCLLDYRNEPEYIHHFLQTSIWHTTPIELLNSLIEIYSPNIQSNELSVTRAKIVCVIKHWVNFFPEDLKDGGVAEERLQEFEKISKSTFEPLSKMPSGGQIPAKAIPKPNEDGKFQFLDFHPTEIARQLTLLEHKRFSEMKRPEFCRQAWNKKGGEIKSPTVVTAIKRFNEVSYWVATEIVFTPNLKQRVTVIKRMIQIASKCMSFNNFHAVIEVMSGLHLSSIQRLKKTWKALPSKYTTLFEEITKLISTEGNYRHYRQALAKAEPPINPYLGVFLRDLTFAEDGNPDFVEDDMFMNFDKLRIISGIMNNISKYQMVSYQFEPVPAIQDYITGAMFLTDSSLYKYSQLCEPSSGSNSPAVPMGGSVKLKRSSMRLPGSYTQ